MNKLDEFRLRLIGYDIIGVVETWANDSMFDSELQIPGYVMYRLDRKHKCGGGLILYVKECLQSSLCPTLMDTGFEESLWCTVKLQSSNVLIGLCYRYPSSTSDNDNMLLSLLTLATTHVGISQIMIMGDFNYPAIDYASGGVSASTSSADYLFFERTQDLFLVQNVLEATRFRSGSCPSKLDYIFTTEENVIREINYDAPLGNSDHVVLSWYTTLQHTDQIQQDEKKFCFWKANYNAVIEDLNDVDWDKEFDCKNADEMWLVFREKLLDLMKKHVPLKTINKRKKKSVWMSAHTVKKIKSRNKAWSKYRKCPSSYNYKMYKDIRNEVNARIREDRCNYQKFRTLLFVILRNILKDFTAT